MSTYVSSVDQLINSYIANVLKSPSHQFQADNFHLNISFDKEGQVTLEGLIWPKSFRDYNLLPYDVTITEEQKEAAGWVKITAVVDFGRRGKTSC